MMSTAGNDGQNKDAQNKDAQNNKEIPVINVEQPINHEAFIGKIPVALPIHTQTIPNAEKPEKFTGVDFKRWQSKMMFYQTTLGLQKHLTEDPMTITDNDTAEKRYSFEAWGQSDYLCRHTVLNGLCNELYNVYNTYKSAKALWDALEKKYKTEDAGTKKYVFGKFLDYKMVDSKSVISQVQEYQLILHDIAAEWMKISESFQVAAAIEKLPHIYL